MDFEALIIHAEGGLHRGDVADLHPSRQGEIVWLHKSGASNEHIATKLNVKLWQVKNYIEHVKRLSEKDND